MLGGWKKAYDIILKGKETSGLLGRVDTKVLKMGLMGRSETSG